MVVGSHQSWLVVGQSLTSVVSRGPVVFGCGWSVGRLVGRHPSSVIRRPLWWPSVVVSRGWVVVSHRCRHQSSLVSHGLWVSHQSSVVSRGLWTWSVVGCGQSWSVVTGRRGL